MNRAQRHFCLLGKNGRLLGNVMMAWSTHIEISKEDVQNTFLCQCSLCKACTSKYTLITYLSQCTRTQIIISFSKLRRHFHVDTVCSTVFWCLLVWIVFSWLLTNVSSWSHHQSQRRKSKAAAAGSVGIVDHVWRKEARGKEGTSSRHKVWALRGPRCWIFKSTGSHGLVMCSSTQETKAGKKLLSKTSSSREWMLAHETLPARNSSS